MHFIVRKVSTNDQDIAGKAFVCSKDYLNFFDKDAKDFTVLLSAGTKTSIVLVLDVDDSVVHKTIKIAKNDRLALGITHGNIVEVTKY